jgi:hypothetical protein
MATETVTAVPNITDVLKEALDPLARARAELEARELDLRAQLDAVRDELRIVDRVLKAAGEPVKAKSKNSKPAHIRPDHLSAIVAWVQAHDVGAEFTQKEARDALGIKASSVTAPIFALLREDGVIRFVRQEGPRKFYAWTGDEPSPLLRERMESGVPA